MNLPVAKWGLQDLRESKALPGILVLKGLPVPLVRPARKVCRAHRGLPATLVQLALKAPRVRQAPQAMRAHKARKV